MSDVCRECGRGFDQIGHHWSHPSVDCEPPELTVTQREIITGLLMGDGTCILPDKTPYVECGTTTRKYLEFLDEMFPLYGQGVRLQMTAENVASQSRKTGFLPDAKAENCSDVYRWRTKSAETFFEFRNWYSSGQKIFPEDIDLTPTVLKHWYCGDGNLNMGRRLRIYSSNESDNQDKINRYFENAGLPLPNRVHTYQSGYSDSDTNMIVWGRQRSKELFEYMGEPLPGFEYKWPEQYR